MSVITVQCGNYANYVGAHFWNIQESEFEYGDSVSTNQKYNTTNHDILYREGVTLNNQTTYTPRLVALDLKGSLGTLPEIGDLYGGPGYPKSSGLNWVGGVEIVKNEPVKKNKFLQQLDREAQIDTDDGEKDRDTAMEWEDQAKIEKQETQTYDMEDQVNYWSDYLYSRFHPKSILMVESFQQNNATHPFDTYGLGRSIWNDSLQDFGDQVEDRIRFFAEECDRVQGFHLLADMGDAFSGLAVRVNNLLLDDYSGKSCVNFGVLRAGLAEYNFNTCASRLANCTLALSELCEEGLVTPLSVEQDWWPLQGRYIDMPNLTFKPDLPYHSSCLLASAIDTATLVYRQKDRAANMSDVIHGLSAGSRNMASLAMSLPLEFTDNKNVESDIFTKLTTLQPATSNTTKSQNISHQRFPDLLTLRGILSSALFDRRSSPYKSLSNAQEYLESCAGAQLNNSMPRLYCHTKPLRTGKPYPQYFNTTVSSDGQILSTPRGDGESVSIVPVLSSWTTGKSSAQSLLSLANRASKLNIAKLSRLLDSGVEELEWTEAVEKIQTICQLYNPTLN